MAEVTIMVLKVDLHCCKCYKKVKKVLCKFRQIRDQVYDEKQNTVTIKVVSCCPEKLRQKIWCKGGKSIKSIEIKPPEKKTKEADKQETDNKKNEGKAPDDKKKEDKATDDKNKGDKAPDQEETPKTATPDPKPDKPPIRVVVELPPMPKPQSKPPEPAPCYPPCYGNPILPGVCCRDCYEGREGGPCQQLGYVCRYPCYCGCHGRPVFDSWGGSNRGYCWSRCEVYCEENPSACSVM